MGPENILIIKLSSIGDVVHSLPFLEVLRARFPEARIDWLVEEEASLVIEGHPALSRMIVSRRKLWERLMFKSASGFSSVLRELIRFLKEVRSVDYDLVVDLQGLLRSGIITGLSRGKRKVGMEGAREGGWLFFSEPPVPVDYSGHAIDRYLQVAQYLGCNSASWKGEVPVFLPDEAQVDMLLEGIEGRNALVAVNPMARWETKLWAPERFARVAELLVEDLSCDVVFTGSEGDRAVIDRIISMSGVEPLNLAGRTTLKELASLYRRCDVLVTTDTGPMHIAAAMGCPVVALFGPTTPRRTGPYGSGHRPIKANLECSPCFKKRCSDMACMRGISVDDVLKAVEDILGEDNGNT